MQDLFFTEAPVFIVPEFLSKKLEILHILVQLTKKFLTTTTARQEQSRTMHTSGHGNRDGSTEHIPEDKDGEIQR